MQVYATRAILPQVKPNVLSPSQGFQARPQGLPPSPRNSINNGPIGVPRPGQPLRRLDSRSSLGSSPASGQFVQLRPYGPARPPGSISPLRSPQPGQLPPQNPLHPSNQRFVYSPGIRGPPPQGAGGQRPPFISNQQAYQQQQQQRANNDPRFQRPDIAPENGPRRPSQESVFPRQLLRNDSSLSLQQRQQLSSNEEIKQPTRPRIVIEKMADINESVDVDKPEGYLQRKKSDVRENGENDDDDDVVMDNEKSPQRARDSIPEGLVNGSKSPLTPKKPTSRPGTATIENPSKYLDKTKELSEDMPSVIFQSRPSSAVNDDKEERKDEKSSSRPPSSKEIDIVKNLTGDSTRDEASLSLADDSMNNKTSRPPSATSTFELIEEIQKPSSPYNDIILENVEQRSELKTSQRSSDNSRSVTPSYLDTPQNVEQAASRTSSRISDKSRSSTPAHLDAPENTEQNKTPDKSRSSTPAESEPHGNAKQESKTPIKTPDKSRANTPAGLEPPENTEQELRTPVETPDKHSRASTPVVQLAPSPNPEKEPRLTPTKTSDKSRSSTPAGIESSGGEASGENPHGDKPGEDTLQVKGSSRPASSLGSPNSASDKDGKSPKSPKSPRSPTIPKIQGKLSMPESAMTPPRSPGGVKGFDNGEQRSLSSGGSPRLNSPKSPAKQTEGEKKKKTSFVETTKKSVEIADTTPTSPSKSPQTPTKPDDEKKSTKKKGFCVTRGMNKAKYEY